MSKSARVQARIDESLKSEAETVFRRLGMSTSEAISLFFAQVGLHKGLPFPVRVPNQETIEAMQELENGGGSKVFENSKELFADLEI